MTIEELALQELPIKITGNGWNDWDENEIKRKGYILGANAVLKEFEDIVYRRYSDDGDTNQRNKDLIKLIRELKGEK